MVLDDCQSTLGVTAHSWRTIFINEGRKGRHNIVRICRNCSDGSSNQFMCKSGGEPLPLPKKMEQMCGSES